MNERKLPTLEELNEQIEKEYKDFLEAHNIFFKPNPNHYPIIDKWNCKYKYYPNKEIIFNKLEELMDYYAKNSLNIIFYDTLRPLTDYMIEEEEKRDDSTSI